jgi:hypothetical protein
MRRMLLVWFLAVGVNGAERSVDANGLNVRSYADDGRLLRRFIAESASGPFTSPVVRNGKVEFYGKGVEGQANAVLVLPEAKYVRSEEAVVGDGVVQFTSERGRVSGRGFRCDLAIGRLTLRSEVQLSTEEFQMSGRQATVDFDAKESKREEVLRTIEVSGEIVVERAATTKAPFERAECSFARYVAQENKVYLKSPVEVWRSGLRSTVEVRSGFVVLELDEERPPNQAVQPTPGSVTPRATSSASK